MTEWGVERWISVGSIHVGTSRMVSSHGLICHWEEESAGPEPCAILFVRVAVGVLVGGENLAYPHVTIAQQVETEQLFDPLVFVLPKESRDEKGCDVLIHAVQHHGWQRGIPRQDPRGAPRGGERDLVLVECRDVALVEAVEPVEVRGAASAVDHLGFDR